MPRDIVWKDIDINHSIKIYPDGSIQILFGDKEKLWLWGNQAEKLTEILFEYVPSRREDNLRKNIESIMENALGEIQALLPD